MRTAVTAVTIAVALAVSATAVAGVIAKSPSSLILRKADFPAGADYEATSSDDSGIGDSLHAAGVDADAAGYLGITYSKKKGSLQVSGVVFTTASAAQAKKAFAVAKTARQTFLRKIGAYGKKATVPPFGDEQVARHDPAGAEGIGSMELLVRRNTVVWLLHVVLERRPRAPAAELLADLTTYARKQKARVGSG